MTEWYSDEALEKQRIVSEWPEDKPLPLELIVGIGQPRTPAEPHERCVCCELDARDEANGVDVDGERYCGICYGRDHHLD